MGLCKLATALVIIGAILNTNAGAADTDKEMNLSLGFRTFYMNRDFDAGIPDTNAGGQAFRADFVSPLWADMVGLGISAVHVVKLGAEESGNYSDVLTPEGEGYTTLEQVYLRVKPTDYIDILLGRMIVITPLLNDLPARLSNPSTQGIHATVSFGGGEFYAFYSDKASANYSETFTSYNAGGENYDVGMLGARYTFPNNIGTHFQYVVADDYLKQFYMNASYPAKLGGYDLLLDLVHMRGADDGVLFGRDYDSNLTGLTAKLSRGNWACVLAYQTMGGNDAYELQWGGQDNTRFLTWGGLQMLDFNADDEQSLQARIDYDPSAVPGLHLMARHTEAWDIDNNAGSNGKRHETNLDVEYALQKGFAKGLALRLRIAHVDGDAEVVPRINDIRFIVNYTVNLLKKDGA